MTQQRKKIAIIEPIGFSENEFNNVKNELKDHELIIFDSRNDSDEALIEKLKSVNIIALTNRPLSYKVISSLDHLEFISVAFSGVDHVDSKAVEEKNIVVKNASGYANTAVAELTIGFMITLARNIVENNNNMANKIGTNTGTELKGKTLGIVGYGNIGKEIERFATVFGMKTLTYRSSNTTADLEGLFKESDYISLNIPLNEKTKGIINKKYFDLMKPSAYLINCARGPIVNTIDLINALDSGNLKGAAIDVFDTEPPLEPNHPLLNRKDIIATPHIGFNTQEALKTKATIAIKHISSFLNS
jgi:D-3-phosphoglycerate dehydrogenase